MPATIEELKVQTSQLSEPERAELASFLLETLEPEPTAEERAAIKAEWNKVIHRRIEEMENGTVKGIPLEDVMERLRREFP